MAIKTCFLIVFVCVSVTLISADENVSKDMIQQTLQQIKTSLGEKIDAAVASGQTALVERLNQLKKRAEDAESQVETAEFSSRLGKIAAKGYLQIAKTIETKLKTINVPSSSTTAASVSVVESSSAGNPSSGAPIEPKLD